MSKAGTIMVRVHPKLLKSASRVLRYAGVNTPEAITLFLKQVVRQGGLPLGVSAPNVKARRVEPEVGNPTQWARKRRRSRAENPTLRYLLESELERRRSCSQMK